MRLWSQGGYELISPGSGWNCGMVRWIRGGDEVWVDERRGGGGGGGGGGDGREGSNTLHIDHLQLHPQQLCCCAQTGIGPRIPGG